MTPAMQRFLDALDGYVDARIALHEASKEKGQKEALDEASKLARQKRFELRQRVEKLVGKG